MKILFVRPPRYMWAFHSPDSSFWQPLGFASMAAVLRNNISQLDIKIIDCPTLRMGWKSTKKMIYIEKPDVLCVGEETVSVHESFKLIKYAKKAKKNTIIIGGGLYFSNMIKHSLNNSPIDFIVVGEGEETLCELIKEIKKNKMKSLNQYKKIRGIAFKHNNTIVKTKNRSLINMESLPIPAYDLLPMHLYGKSSTTHKDFAAIEHSRGCTNSCNFCTLWKQMSNNGKPCYRTKSVKKTIDEVKHLIKKYDRKTLCWVDGTWNLDSKWNKEFAQTLIKEKITIDHSTWMRADCIVRDEKKGIFKLQVKAGLKQAMIGVERTNDQELKKLEKKGSFETTKQAFKILKKYPSVLSIATYIYGLPNETAQTLKSFYKNLKKIPKDIGIPLPLTPYPGTKYFNELNKQKLIQTKDFKYYNFINPIIKSRKMSRNKLIHHMLLNEFKISTRKEQLAHFNIKKERRSNAKKHLAWDKVIMTFRYYYGMVYEVITGKMYNYNIKPKWYDE